jgi:hypothetical protein
MEQPRLKALFRRASFSILLIALAWATPTQAQCVDSSDVKVNGLKVRSITVQTLFGKIPAALQQQLDGHRGEAYSADQANKYSREVIKFINEDPAQQKFQKLIANKVKFSIKAAYYELGCVRPADVAECQKSFGPDTTQCVDVTLKGKNLEIDALNASPYLLLLPRSTLVALFGAIPRPLLALNPSFGADQDRKFGPSLEIDTSTDLLDLGRIAAEEKSGATAAPPPPPSTTAAPAAPAPTGAAPTDDSLTVTFPGTTPGTAAVEEEPPAPPVDETSDTKLLFSMKGRKSLTRAFYDTGAGLTFERSEPLARFQRLALEAKFDAFNVPHGEGSFLRNAGSLGFSTDVRLQNSPFSLLSFTGKYRWSRNRFFSGNGSLPTEIASENGFESRFVADGNVKKGLARVLVWFDGGSLNLDKGSYQRLAAEVGYSKEFVIPHKKEFRKIIVQGQECLTSYGKDPTKNEQTVGVELQAGAGRVWGSAPEYALFYGGNLSGNLLYDDLSSQSLTAFPAGPLLRSIRRKQAGVSTPAPPVRGGTSFWHVNLNVSIPVAAWSSPLIPPEWVGASVVTSGAMLDPNNSEHKQFIADNEEFDGQLKEGDAVCRDLKFTLKNAVRKSGVNLLVANRARAMLTSDQRKALMLNPNAPLTPQQQGALTAAQQAYADHKRTVEIEVKALFDKEILPITDFVADQANIFSVKPLVMFDAARLGLDNSVGSRTRYAAGGGLQLDVVLARFELGYLSTLNRAPGDDRGNFVFRMVLKRLF